MLKDNLAKKLAEQGNRITRNTLASKVGISQASFSQIMTGAVKNPGVYTIAKIAKELGCSIDELIGRDAYVSKKIASETEQIECNPDLALNVATTVLDALEEVTKAEIDFEALLEIISSVYKYSVGKNPDLVDEYFAKWFIQHFIDSMRSNKSEQYAIYK